MLDVIGAGAAATSGDWHELWRTSIESKRIQEEIEAIHIEGRSRPAVEASIRTEFATPWFYQTIQLLKRDAQAHWRNPTYLMAKLILNTVGGLFIGFTFFHSKDSQQGTQNKLFVSCLLSLNTNISLTPNLVNIHGDHP
jgi:ATP-binding cassette subfamily G (WHITE) protein 2 (SNQ2)